MHTRHRTISVILPKTLHQQGALQVIANVFVALTTLQHTTPTATHTVTVCSEHLATLILAHLDASTSSRAQSEAQAESQDSLYLDSSRNTSDAVIGDTTPGRSMTKPSCDVDEQDVVSSMYALGALGVRSVSLLEASCEVRDPLPHDTVHQKYILKSHC